MSSKIRCCRSPEAQPLKLHSIITSTFHWSTQVIGSMQTIADSREREINPTSWWGGWPRTEVIFNSLQPPKPLPRKLTKGTTTAKRPSITWSKAHNCHMLTVLMPTLKLLSPTDANTNSISNYYPLLEIYYKATSTIPHHCQHNKNQWNSTFLCPC